MARANGRFDVVLQGSGRLVLMFRDEVSKNEMGAFMDAARRHLNEGLPIAVLSGVGDVIDNRPLNERNVTEIVTHDRSSGRYHRRYIAVMENGDERMLVDERCQADQSGKYDIVDQIPESADRNVLCRWCYPVVETPVTPTAGAI